MAPLPRITSEPANPPTLQRLLSTAEAAEYLGLADNTLRIARVRGNGPKFIAIGRTIRYRVEDLETFVTERIRSSTSQAA